MDGMPDEPVLSSTLLDFETVLVELMDCVGSALIPVPVKLVAVPIGIEKVWFALGTGKPEDAAGGAPPAQ